MSVLRRCALPIAIASISFAPAAGLVMTSTASAAGAAPTCNETVDANAVHSTTTTIQAAIDVAHAGDTICVWPGLYNQDQALNRDPNTGGAGGNSFNIFVGSNATGVTIQGLDGSGNAITTAPEGLADTAAPLIEAGAQVPDFGSDNIFIQANGVTLRGLEINGTPNDVAKSVEIDGDGDTVTDVAFTPSTVSGGVGIYISDFNFDAVHNTSTVKSYSFTNNTFDGDQNEVGIYVASGAGWSGPTSGRVISGNKFSNMDDAMDFAGPTAGVAWLLYPVGAATITGNTFSNIGRRHVLAWGTGGPGVGYGAPNWCGIISGNVFDRGSFIWQGSAVCPSGSPRTWDSGGFTDIAGLYSSIQHYGSGGAFSDHSQAGDTVQVLAGTYDEALTISHALTLLGANAGVSGTGARGAESLVERLAADTGPAFTITTADPVTINGFATQFNATDAGDAVGGVLDSIASGNQLNFSNNVVSNSAYSNALLYDTSATTSTFANNLFTSISQPSGSCTGVIGAWGNTGTNAQAALTVTGNTFSNITDTDGCPAMNLNTVSGSISGNTFENIHQYGLLLAGTLGNLSITNNLFDNIHNDAPGSSANRGSGVRLFGQPAFNGPVTITQNTFSNDFHGVRVPNDSGPADLSSGDLVVVRNAFTTDASDGISVDPTTLGTLNGTCNWWGSASGPSDAGPGTGTGVTAGVNFSGWLTTSNLNGGCPVPPTHTSVTTSGLTGLSVSFTPGPADGSPFTSFTVTCVSLDGHPTVTATGSTSPIIVSGVAGGHPYQCTVTETNAVGTSGPSAPTSVVWPGAKLPTCNDTLTAPSKLSTAPGNASAVVSWAPSTTCVAGYIVTPYVGSVPQPATLIPGSGTTTVLPGLTNGVTYTFTVAAENGTQVGPASAMSGTVAVGTPAASTVLKVTRVASGALKVAFTVPKNNGAKITRFTATCASSNHGVTKAKSGPAGPLTVNGLTKGKSYTCVVTATNARGTSRPSGRSKAVKA